MAESAMTLDNSKTERCCAAASIRRASHPDRNVSTDGRLRGGIFAACPADSRQAVASTATATEKSLPTAICVNLRALGARTSTSTATSAKPRFPAASRATLERILASSNSAAELEANAGKAGFSTSLTGWFAPLSEAAPEALAGAGDLRKDLSALSAKAPVSRKVYQGREGNPVAVAFSGEQLPSDAEWAEKKAGLLRGVADQKRNVMLEAFLSDRRKSAKVSIDPEALK